RVVRTQGAQRPTRIQLRNLREEDAKRGAVHRDVVEGHEQLVLIRTGADEGRAYGKVPRKVEGPVVLRGRHLLELGRERRRRAIGEIEMSEPGLARGDWRLNSSRVSLLDEGP